MDTKTCTKCGETKALTDFCKHPRCRGGYSFTCIVCKKETDRAWRLANPELQKATSVAWKLKNAERVKTKMAEWRKANPEKVKSQQIKWRKENQERSKAIDAASYSKRKSSGKTKAEKAKHVEAVTPNYAACKLGIPVAQLTPDLLEAKRQQIEIHRLQRQLQKTLKELDDK